jgi:hypothetical protein
VWRRLRVREDRGGPRFARWEPFPSRPVGAKKGRCRAQAVGDRASEKDTPTAAPGAGKAHSLGPVALNTAIRGAAMRKGAPRTGGAADHLGSAFALATIANGEPAGRCRLRKNAAKPALESRNQRSKHAR